ncbi:hypothetical protein N7486_008907, partial [Penicillium sp. IBT 16267x]
ALTEGAKNGLTVTAPCHVGACPLCALSLSYTFFTLPSFPPPRLRVLLCLPSLTVACPLPFLVLPSSIVSARPAPGASFPRLVADQATREPPTASSYRGLRVLIPCPHPCRPVTFAKADDEAKPESDSCEEDISTTTTSDSEQGDATYETDLTELEDFPSSRKRLRADENLVLEPETSYDSEDIYHDPLDEGGHRYCASQVRNKPNEPKWREVEDSLRQASNNDMYRFLRWCLQLDRGEDGRHTPGINKASTLEIDWKNLRLYHQRLTKIVINDDDGSEIRRGMKYLVQEFGLDTQPGRKTPVYIEDIGPFNETILSTQEKNIFTVHRRSALLSLQFKDLVISLQKDPHRGPPVPMIELTPEGTKKFLGITKLYGYEIPNYFCTSRDRLRTLSYDLPAYTAFWHPVSCAGISQSGAEFEGLATETLYQQRM